MKPDIMDGVPEEPGYYWIKAGNNDWRIVLVDYEWDENLTAYGTGSSADQFKLEEDDLHIWSEKIEPPEGEQ